MMHRVFQVKQFLQGKGDGNNKESSVTLVHDVDSVKDDGSDGKDDEAEPASDAGKDIGVVPDIEEPAPDGLTIVSIFCHLVSL